MSVQRRYSQHGATYTSTSNYSLTFFGGRPQGLSIFYGVIAQRCEVEYREILQSDSGNGFIFSHCKIPQKGFMANVRRKAVSVVVHGPLPALSRVRKMQLKPF